jgi:hypothetical protein
MPGTSLPNTYVPLAIRTYIRFRERLYESFYAELSIHLLLQTVKTALDEMNFYTSLYYADF